MRVAIATQDLARIDAHLGWARHLMIYEVSEEGYHFLAAETFPAGRQDGDHAKLGPRLEAMKGCGLVFLADVGPEGEHALGRAGLVPVLRFAGQPVAVALDALRDAMRGKATSWLRRAEQRHRREGARPC